MAEVNTPDFVPDEVIVRQTINRLASLLEEDRQERVKQAQRETNIKKARLLIEFYSNGKTYEDIIAIPFDYSPTDLVSSTHENEDEFPQGNKTRENAYTSGTWKDRIITVLRNENKVLTVKEMVSILKDYHNNYSDIQLTGVVSNVINTKLVKEGSLRVYKPEIKMRGYYYGNPSWWDGDKLREEHKPKPIKQELWK